MILKFKMTFNDPSGNTLFYKKKMHLYIVSNHRNFYQNQFINDCARKKKAKILESQSFLVRYRRTCVLDKRDMEKRSVRDSFEK